MAQLAARGSHNPKVASSILVGSICLYSSVWQSMRLVSARSRVRSSLEAVRVGVVGNISACHADAPGSIPGRGDFFFGVLKPFLGSKPCYKFLQYFLLSVQQFFFKCATIFFFKCATFFFLSVQQFFF